MSKAKLQRLIDDGCTMNVVYQEGFDFETELADSTSPDAIYDAVNGVEGSIIEVMKDGKHMGNILIIDQGVEDEDIADHHSNDYLDSMLA
jgi:hypothetical protein